MITEETWQKVIDEYAEAGIEITEMLYQDRYYRYYHFFSTDSNDVLRFSRRTLKAKVMSTTEVDLIMIVDEMNSNPNTATLTHNKFGVPIKPNNFNKHK